ncbi:MAG: hypothetical protein EOM00_15770 [Clostridia bacterium]|nr:hypothetical protein [Clostridia bacterium]
MTRKEVESVLDVLFKKHDSSCKDTCYKPTNDIWITLDESGVTTVCFNCAREIGILTYVPFERIARINLTDAGLHIMDGSPYSAIYIPLKI